MTDVERRLDVLTLNSGSSSLKFGLYRAGSLSLETLVSGEATLASDKDGTFHARDARGTTLCTEAIALQNQAEAIVRIGRLLIDAKMPAPAAIGHRIVHGGPKLRQHCLIDDDVLAKLKAATAFAPLHMPAALSVIGSAKELFPGLPQVACFDTTFHAGLPDVARVLPIPKALQADGIQRYGFHGLSYESILRQLGQPLLNRIVIAHLGNGASVTAVKDSRSIDTSMGLTPSGGVIMGTRGGDLDPGVLLYLMRERKFDAAMLGDLINHRSGLLGISVVSSDMRALHAAAPANADARLAIDMFCISVRKMIAAMIAVLDGIDMLVFTGGIGEHDAQVRDAICSGLSWIGVGLDAARNRSVTNPISNTASRFPVLVLAAQENEQIARHSWELLTPAFTPSPPAKT